MTGTHTHRHTHMKMHYRYKWLHNACKAQQENPSKQNVFLHTFKQFHERMLPLVNCCLVAKRPFYVTTIFFTLSFGLLLLSRDFSKSRHTDAQVPSEATL